MKKEMVEKKEISLTEIEKLALHIVTSGNFQQTINSKSQAVVKILAGKELGLSPMMAISKLFIVNEKLGLPGEIIGGMIKRSEKYNYKVVQDTWTDEFCEVEFLEKVDGKWELQGKFSFGKKQAEKILVNEKHKTIKLCDKQNWQDYPRNHYFYMALSQGGRMFCPDATQGVYAREEIMVIESDNTIEAKIETAKQRVSEKTPETAQNGEIIPDEVKPTSETGSQPDVNPTATEQATDTVSTTRKTATPEKQEEIYELAQQLPGTKKDRETTMKIFLKHLKLDPEIEPTTAEANALIKIIKDNIKTPVTEKTEEPAEKKEGCSIDFCVGCWSKDKKTELTARMIALSEKRGGDLLCYTCQKGGK